MNEAVANACVNAATYHEAKLIITLTTTGTAARLISKYRPRCPIIVICRDAHIGAAQRHTFERRAKTGQGRAYRWRPRRR